MSKLDNPKSFNLPEGATVLCTVKPKRISKKQTNYLYDCWLGDTHKRIGVFEELRHFDADRLAMHLTASGEPIITFFVGSEKSCIVHSHSGRKIGDVALCR